MEEVTEVIVVEDDGMEDDLEEGEITDDDSLSDIEVEVVSPEPKKKKLPKRYCLHDKKLLVEKHKKECKHSRYSSHKVKNKIKSSPILNGVRKHKSSCQRQKSSMIKNNSPKLLPLSNNLPSPFNNDSSSVVSAFKNFTSPPRPAPSHPSFDDSDNYSDLLLSYKKSREHQNHKNKSKDYNDLTRNSSSKNLTKSNGSLTMAKSQSKHSLNEKKSPKMIETNLSVSGTTCSKKFKTRQYSNEKLALLKQSLNKTSLTKIVNDQSLNKKSVPAKVENKQPLHQQNSKPELEIDDQEVYDLIEEIGDKEESEDEEELRRIALATFARRTLEKQRAENANSIKDSADSLPNQSSVTVLVNGGIGNNYEVVDMELDDENFVEDVEDSLFFIDNNPVSSKFKSDLFNGHCNNVPTDNFLPPQKDIHFLPNHAQSNEDFEEALLRAELIASINYKKKAVIIPKSTDATIDKLPEVARKVGNVLPSSPIPKQPARYSKGRAFHSVSTNLKRIDVVKLNNSKVQNSKKIIAPKPRNINATTERLIITLNNDSSSDESDEDEPSNENILGNTVNSIDALISNARHNSDIKTNGANLNHVSCLSKAQQEEYKKLRNLLAEKEPMTIIPQPVKEKSIAENQNLNFLTNKISVAKEKLDKEMESLTSTEKEVLSKKKVFITSKLKFQHLQEQLHAAKLTKTANLKAWKLCEAKLVNAKNNVAKHKALISLLETEFNNRQFQFEQNSSSPIL